jgi:hypothetical protein
MADGYCALNVLYIHLIFCDIVLKVKAVPYKELIISAPDDVYSQHQVPTYATGCRK